MAKRRKSEDHEAPAPQPVEELVEQEEGNSTVEPPEAHLETADHWPQVLLSTRRAAEGQGSVPVRGRLLQGHVASVQLLMVKCQCGGAQGLEGHEEHGAERPSHIALEEWSGVSDTEAEDEELDRLAMEAVTVVQAPEMRPGGEPETLFAYCQRLAKERGGAALAGQRVWCYWWAQPNGRQLSEGVKTLSAEERVTLMKQVQAGHAWLGSLSPQHEAGLGVWYVAEVLGFDDNTGHVWIYYPSDGSTDRFFMGASFVHWDARLPLRPGTDQLDPARIKHLPDPTLAPKPFSQDQLRAALAPLTPPAPAAAPVAAPAPHAHQAGASAGDDDDDDLPLGALQARPGSAGGAGSSVPEPTTTTATTMTKRPAAAPAEVVEAEAGVKTKKKAAEQPAPAAAPAPQQAPQQPGAAPGSGGGGKAPAAQAAAQQAQAGRASAPASAAKGAALQPAARAPAETAATGTAQKQPPATGSAGGALPAPTKPTPTTATPASRPSPAAAAQQPPGSSNLQQQQHQRPTQAADAAAAAPPPAGGGTSKPGAAAQQGKPAPAPRAPSPSAAAPKASASQLWRQQLRAEVPGCPWPDAGTPAGEAMQTLARSLALLLADRWVDLRHVEMELVRLPTSIYSAAAAAASTTARAQPHPVLTTWAPPDAPPSAAGTRSPAVLAEAAEALAHRYLPGILLSSSSTTTGDGGAAPEAAAAAAPAGSAAQRVHDALVSAAGAAAAALGLHPRAESLVVVQQLEALPCTATDWPYSTFKPSSMRNQRPPGLRVSYTLAPLRGGAAGAAGGGEAPHAAQGGAEGPSQPPLPPHVPGVQLVLHRSQRGLLMSTGGAPSALLSGGSSGVLPTSSASTTTTSVVGGGAGPGGAGGAGGGVRVSLQPMGSAGATATTTTTVTTTTARLPAPGPAPPAPGAGAGAPPPLSRSSSGGLQPGASTTPAPQGGGAAGQIQVPYTGIKVADMWLLEIVGCSHQQQQQQQQQQQGAPGSAPDEAAAAAAAPPSPSSKAAGGASPHSPGHQRVFMRLTWTRPLSTLPLGMAANGVGQAPAAGAASSLSPGCVALAEAVLHAGLLLAGAPHVPQGSEAAYGRQAVRALQLSAQYVLQAWERASPAASGAVGGRGGGGGRQQ